MEKFRLEGTFSQFVLFSYPVHFLCLLLVQSLLNYLASVNNCHNIVFFFVRMVFFSIVACQDI